MQYLLLFTSLLISFCEPQKEQVPTIALNLEGPSPLLDTVETFPYHLKEIVRTYPLDRSLTEISGLTYLSNRNQLAAINDEKGNIYFIGLDSGKIEEKVDFGSSGDYEGIEHIGNRIFVVKSNGNLYVHNLDTGTSEKTIKTQLSSSNDVEGLAFDSHSGDLYLACKGSPFVGRNPIIKTQKALYRYNPENGKLDTKPMMVVDDDDLIGRLAGSEEFLSLSKKKQSRLVRRAKDFSPSAIAVHPITRDIYILSSVGKMLVVMETAGKIQWIIPLDANVFRQPEGICFAPDGRMFISNEGKGLVAKIYSFDYAVPAEG